MRKSTTQKHWLEMVFESSYFWGVVAFVAIGLGFRPRESDAGTLICLALALATATAAVWFHPRVRTHRRRTGIAILTALFCTLLLVPLGFWLTKPSPAPSVALFQAQLKEFEQLQNFIGNKNESELRELFGFTKLLSINLWILRSGLAPEKYSPQEINAISAYIKSNPIEVDTRFGVLARGENAPNFTVNKGAIAVITLPKEYVAGRTPLVTFESSITLPSTVRPALLELDQAITSNTNLLFDVINDKVKENPDNLILYDDPHSKFFSAINNAYWERFAPLQPKAQKVIDLMRAYLKVDQQ